MFVVDDDAAALRSLSWLLRQADLSVRPFSSGREFLAAYRPDEPGCLVLDACMPAMSGLDVQQELSARHVGLPIIFMSGRSDVATCARALHCGAFVFLRKPIDDALLLAHIDRALVLDAEQRHLRAATGKAATLANHARRH